MKIEYVKYRNGYTGEELEYLNKYNAMTSEEQAAERKKPYPERVGGEYLKQHKEAEAAREAFAAEHGGRCTQSPVAGYGTYPWVTADYTAYK
jgi:hypothetical protein